MVARSTSFAVVLALALVANTLPTVFGQGSSSPKVLWKVSTGGNITTRPLLNGKRVFVTSLDNNFYAINADNGAHVWNINGVQPGTTPVVSKDGLSMFLNVGGSSCESGVYACNSLSSINLDNGKRNWRGGGGEDQRYGPAVLCADTGTIYAVTMAGNGGTLGNGVLPMDPDTGAPLGPATQPPQPHVGDDVSVWLSSVPTTLSSDCTTIYGQYSDDYEESMNISAVNIKTGQTLWDVTMGQSCSSNIKFPVTLNLNNDHVYVVVGCDSTAVNAAFSNTLYAYYAQTGILAWQYIGGVNSVTFTAQPALSPDGTALFASSSDGNVYALNATDGQVMWSFRCAGAPPATPAVTSDGSTVIITTAGGSVHGVHAANGTEAWTYFTGSGIAAGITLNDDDSVAYFGNDNGYIYALAISSC